jgi:hypothetical protein
MATVVMSQQLMSRESISANDRARTAQGRRVVAANDGGYAGVASALAGLASFAYALAVCVGSAVPRLGATSSVVAGLAVDAALIAALVLHFHFRVRPEARRVSGTPGATWEIALLIALFFALWQPLPMHVWAVTSGAAVKVLWIGYVAGWILTLSRSRSQWGLVAGVVLVEWSAPTLSLGHLVFAIGLTAFVVAYRGALARFLSWPGMYRGRS